MLAGNLKLTKSAPVSTPDTASKGRAPGVDILPLNRCNRRSLIVTRASCPCRGTDHGRDAHATMFGLRRARDRALSTTMRKASFPDENSRESNRGQQIIIQPPACNELVDFFRRVIYCGLAVRGRHSVSRLYHLAGHSHEFFQASTWNDDRIPTTMRFLGDTHKAPSLVFAKFNVEMLAFDLEFFRDNYVIHDAWRGYYLPILHLTTHRQRRNLAK